ncbi:MAG TPA: 5'/3'-nucleotidase SurE, partial [Gemmatimonadaceae bacterium]|nr:5'/3'-nucleotidase SurE [Gemmatimonadaceae bacterium]
AAVAAEVGEIHIVAPDVEQSSMGHAITHSRPLSIKRTPIGSYDAHRVNGTPADCVALGVSLFPDVDVVLSGINLGPNVGNAMWHSGTLAAAKQAALLGLRGIALSTPTGDTEPDFARLQPWVSRVVRLLLDTDLKLVNVNVPPDPIGIRWTRQAVTQYDGRIVPMKDPMGRSLYWLSVGRIDEPEEETDRWAMRNQYVSITPLRLDLTDYAALSTRRREPVS